MVKWTRRRGAYRKDDSLAWVTELLNNLPSNWEVENVVLVCDNAPCHSNLEAIEENFVGIKILRLSPYSPMLNPIEIIWSKVKGAVKNQMRVPQVSPPNVGEQRLQYVENLIDSAMASVTNEDCNNAAQHANSFFPAALAQENMLVGR